MIKKLFVLGILFLTFATTVSAGEDVLNILNFPVEFKDIDFGLNSEEILNKELNRNNNVVTTDYHLKNIDVLSYYEQITKTQVKQQYILTNKLDQKQEVTFTIDHEIDSDIVSWEDQEFIITEVPKSFRAFMEKSFPDPTTQKLDLTGHTIYIKDSYYDFKDITSLNYEVQVLKENNKNILRVIISKNLGPYEEFVIDPLIGWTEHEVARYSVIRGPNFVRTSDVDSDGWSDIATSSWNGAEDKIQVFYNSPNQTWTEETVTTNIDAPRSVHAADLDGDGDIDLMSAIERDHEFQWYEQSYNNSQRVWIQRTIGSNTLYPHHVYSDDLDGDGDQDVIGSSTGTNSIQWFENDGQQPPQWTERNVSVNIGSAWTTYTEDIDQDGDVDIIAPLHYDDQIVWFENDGQQPPQWTSHLVSNNTLWPWSVHANDLDGDGDIDIMSASETDDKIAWFENDGQQNWIEHVVSTTNDLATTVYSEDLDDDEDIDIIAGAHSSKQFAWYENNGAINPSWTERIIYITTGSGGPLSLHTADIDLDSDIDVVGVSGYSSSSRLYWFESNFSQPLPPSTCEKITENTVLRNDINATSTCMTIDASNITLDCNGTTIRGPGFGYGIRAGNKEGVTIRNCNVEDFRIGIALKRTRDFTINDNNLFSNRAGIYLEEAENNFLSNNNASDNAVFGIFMRGYIDNHNLTGNFACNNNMHDIAQVNPSITNLGNLNTCSSPYNWEDQGFNSTCEFQCA